MKVVFDLDGTLADITHRTHFVRNGKRDWDSFFAACVDDVPVPHVFASFKAHIAAGHDVRIWSARSDAVRAETETWLMEVAGVDADYLQHMRADGDNTTDVELKRYWLNQEDPKPDLVYDDRPRVVAMWRAEGIPCFQVTADWEDEGRIIPPVSGGPLLTLMVGPSGAGKSDWLMRRGIADGGFENGVISSDQLRELYTGDFRSQERNDDVFTALHRIAKARLSCGLPVTIDATNLRRRDRLACVALAPYGSRIQYVVVDRPLKYKIATGGWRNKVIIGGKTLVESHHERMQSALRDILRGDGLPNVDVLDMRVSPDAVFAPLPKVELAA